MFHRCFKDVKMAKLISIVIGLSTLMDSVTSAENSGLVCIFTVNECKVNTLIRFDIYNLLYCVMEIQLIAFLKLIYQ
jgi:hypothetical protein